MSNPYENKILSDLANLRLSDKTANDQFENTLNQHQKHQLDYVTIDDINTIYHDLCNYLYFYDLYGQEYPSGDYIEDKEETENMNVQANINVENRHNHDSYDYDESLTTLFKNVSKDWANLMSKASSLPSLELAINPPEPPSFLIHCFENEDKFFISNKNQITFRDDEANWNSILNSKKYFCYFLKLKRIEVGRGKISSVPLGIDSSKSEINFRMKGFPAVSYKVFEIFLAQPDSVSNSSKTANNSTVQDQLFQCDQDLNDQKDEIKNIKTFIEKCQNQDLDDNFLFYPENYFTDYTGINYKDQQMSSVNEANLNFEMDQNKVVILPEGLSICDYEALDSSGQITRFYNKFAVLIWPKE